ncbi:hypothetical protein [Crocosphaera sp.]|uniref:hypothetical protein n=1 Tax=Crocosphaera sp. TaxID=2729996 RepID=UPI003F20434E|nr:hypothetical protein [Crocosphaera sp.]
MKFNPTFAIVLTFALLTNINVNINVSAFGAPVNAETIKENIENNKSDKNTKPSQDGSQGVKCVYTGSC